MKIRSSLIAVALATLPVAANAAVYDFTFAGSADGSGQIVTSDTLNAVGGYDITGVSGIFGGFTITGLVPNPAQPNGSSTGIFTYDNVLFPSAPLVFSRYGIGFTTTGLSFNIFDSVADGTTPPLGEPYGLIDSSGAHGFGTFRLTAAVPEPATWLTMIAGFGLLGAALRRRAVAPAMRFA